MAIITISREIAALGDETAHELADLLGYRYIEKATIEDKFASYGFTERKIDKFDEKKPTFWASLSQDRDDYLHYLRSAVFSEAVGGNCVFVGRGVMALLKDLPSVVSVRLVAPMAVRVERVKSYFSCDDKRARQIIMRSDHDRAGFHRYFFDMDWLSAVNYHAVINTSSLHPATVAEIVKELVKRIVSPEAESRSAALARDLCLSQEVVNHILYEKKIPVHFLEAKAINGELVLHGVSNSQSSVEAAVMAAKEMKGVSSVRGEIQVVQEYSVMP